MPREALTRRADGDTGWAVAAFVAPATGPGAGRVVPADRYAASAATALYGLWPEPQASTRAPIPHSSRT
ncbi:hypothetical protein [Streptomyces sp. NPDC059828]|uniref:hypothetical protein n=1 Tax=Streptomyces sp. NPDC059828 TaxID=3346965 RepID=UPI00365C97E7